METPDPRWYHHKHQQLLVNANKKWANWRASLFVREKRAEGISTRYVSDRRDEKHLHSWTLPRRLPYKFLLPVSPYVDNSKRALLNSVVLTSAFIRKIARRETWQTSQRFDDNNTTWCIKNERKEPNQRGETTKEREEKAPAEKKKQNRTKGLHDYLYTIDNTT